MKIVGKSFCSNIIYSLNFFLVVVDRINDIIGHRYGKTMFSNVLMLILVGQLTCVNLQNNANFFFVFYLYYV